MATAMMESVQAAVHALIALHGLQTGVPQQKPIYFSFSSSGTMSPAPVARGGHAQPGLVPALVPGLVPMADMYGQMLGYPMPVMTVPAAPGMEVYGLQGGYPMQGYVPALQGPPGMQPPADMQAMQAPAGMHAMQAPAGMHAPAGMQLPAGMQPTMDGYALQQHALPAPPQHQGVPLQMQPQAMQFQPAADGGGAGVPVQSAPDAAYGGYPQQYY